MQFQEIDHDGITEVLLSPARFKYIGVVFCRNGYPMCYYGTPQRKYCLLVAKGGLTYRPRVRCEESQDGYLRLVNKYGEGATVATNSVDDFLSALQELGELR